MLDDVYKSAVVLITDKYVNDENDFAAGSAAIALFKAVKEKGWHEVKLLDVSGEPYNDENVAKDDFEKEAVQKLKAGKPIRPRRKTRRRPISAGRDGPSGGPGKMRHVPRELQASQARAGHRHVVLHA